MNPDEIILEVDFNARTVDDKIRLSPKVEALLGKQVWLTDGDIRVLGTIERTLNGFVALPDWKSLIRLQENHVAYFALNGKTTEPIDNPQKVGSN